MPEILSRQTVGALVLDAYHAAGLNPEVFVGSSRPRWFAVLVDGEMPVEPDGYTYFSHYFVIKTGSSRVMINSTLPGVRPLITPEDSKALEGKLMGIQECVAQKLGIGRIAVFDSVDPSQYAECGSLSMGSRALLGACGYRQQVYGTWMKKVTQVTRSPAQA